ncbi:MULTISPECIES: glycerate kinase [Gracilibacillus]|uniref:glycerate kinase n=1 Tax=Gracilibacillus TaxID=74385 RepID=UPI00082433DE|nr:MULTISPECIES: glycerate kinase [Gracilibacillus]
MKVVVAPDSFKGSLSAAGVAENIQMAIEEISDSHVITKPMADGGEGTIEAILSAKQARRMKLMTAGPLGEVIETSYAIIDKQTAVIETAMHAGLYQVPEHKRNPDWTTSFGIGQAISAALDQGCTQFIVGLGGSATNDGGLGMLQALGLKAFDTAGNVLDKYGQDLLEMDRLDTSGIDKRVFQADFQIACDVDNPLCGQHGASLIYGPQKGATPEQIKQYDQALNRFASLLEEQLHGHWRDTAGAGAAGGLGFAFLTLNGHLSSGAKLIAEAIDLEQHIKEADFIITGEGQSDEQTLYGKAPGYVAELANQYQKPVILLSGAIVPSEKLRQHFYGCFSIVNRPLSLEECMSQTRELLREQTKQIFTFIQHFFKQR